jgi:hypothetical protein
MIEVTGEYIAGIVRRIKGHSHISQVKPFPTTHGLEICHFDVEDTKYWVTIQTPEPVTITLQVTWKETITELCSGTFDLSDLQDDVKMLHEIGKLLDDAELAKARLCVRGAPATNDGTPTRRTTQWL